MPMARKKYEIYVKDNDDGTKQLVKSAHGNSVLGHFTGVGQTHIYSHDFEKVVCGSNSNRCGGLNHDIDVDLAREIGIEKMISCVRCISWFNKHYN